MDRTTLGCIAAFMATLGGFFLYEYSKPTTGKVTSEYLYEGLIDYRYQAVKIESPHYELRIAPAESSPRTYVVRGDLQDLRRLERSISEKDWVKVFDWRKTKNDIGVIVVSASDVEKI